MAGGIKSGSGSNRSGIAAWRLKLEKAIRSGFSPASAAGENGIKTAWQLARRRHQLAGSGMAAQRQHVLSA